MRGRIREVVIYFKFHENRSRGLGAVEGRKSPSPTDKGYGLYTACTTVQAVIHTRTNYCLHEYLYQIISINVYSHRPELFVTNSNRNTDANNFGAVEVDDDSTAVFFVTFLL